MNLPPNTLVSPFSYGIQRFCGSCSLGCSQSAPLYCSLCTPALLHAQNRPTLALCWEPTTVTKRNLSLSPGAEGSRHRIGALLPIRPRDYRSRLVSAAHMFSVRKPPHERPDPKQSGYGTANERRAGWVGTQLYLPRRSGAFGEGASTPKTKSVAKRMIVTTTAWGSIRGTAVQDRDLATPANTAFFRSNDSLTVIRSLGGHWASNFHGWVPTLS